MIIGDLRIETKLVHVALEAVHINTMPEKHLKKQNKTNKQKTANLERLKWNIHTWSLFHVFSIIKQKHYMSNLKCVNNHINFPLHFLCAYTISKHNCLHVYSFCPHQSIKTRLFRTKEENAFAKCEWLSHTFNTFELNSSNMFSLSKYDKGQAI